MVEERHRHGRLDAFRDEAGRAELDPLRRPGDDGDHGVVRHHDVARGSERIDVAAEAEAVLDEGLDAGARSPGAPVAEPDDDAVARVQVAIDHIDDHGLLERALVALLVEAHAERLDGRRRLAGQQRPGLVLGADVVGGTRVGGLEQGPV
ncbi:MAG: hypothetical protein WAP03_30230 [Methylorubrum rhodinum]